MNLLRVFLDLLAPTRDTHARVCAAPEDALLSLAHPTHVAIQNVACVALLPFREPLVRACIHEAKYHDDQKAIRMLGAVLRDYLLTLHEDSPFDAEDIVLIPVPLSRRRKRERGYNQVERVARAATEHLDDSFRIDTSLAVRARDTISQTALSREKRRMNMAGAFSLSQDIPRASTIVLLDDVVTTGATLAALASVCAERPECTVKAVALAH